MVPCIPQDELGNKDNTNTMANNKYIRGISGRGFRVKNAAGDWVTLKEGVQAQVDLEVEGTQDILSREKDNFVRVANNATTAVIKPLHRRGFRVKPAGGEVTITEANPGVFTLTAHNLKAGDAFQLTTTDTLPTNLVANTTYYVISTSLTANTFRAAATVGGSAINTSGAVQAGTHTLTPLPKSVNQDSDVKVDLNDGATKRFLKRNFGRYIVLAAGGDTLQSVVGLQNLQSSFRVEDPVLTLEFAGANNDLTFVPKTSDGEVVTVALTDPGTNETAISASVVDDTNIVVELDITQNVQASATPVQAGVNNDLVYTATAAYPGTAGNAITVAYVMPVDANQVEPLVITVTGTDIVVSLAVAADGSTVTTTGDLLKAAILADPDASALVTVADAGGNDGSGLLVAVAETSLANGVDWAIRSTAAEVVTEIEATTAADDLVTVTYEGTGAGVVELVEATALGADPEGLGRGEVVTNVDLTDPFNLGQLRRRFKAWVEN